jgi:hypothetical protein
MKSRATFVSLPRATRWASVSRSSRMPRLGRSVSGSCRATCTISSVSMSRANASEAIAASASSACSSAATVDRARSSALATSHLGASPSWTLEPISPRVGGVVRSVIRWRCRSSLASSTTAAATCSRSERVCARTAAARSTVSRRAFSRPRVTARVATSRVPSGTASSTSIQGGAAR